MSSFWRRTWNKTRHHPEVDFHILDKTSWEISRDHAFPRFELSRVNRKMFRVGLGLKSRHIRELAFGYDRWLGFLLEGVSRACWKSSTRS